MSNTVKLSNGAAHWGYGIVSTHKGDLEDLFFSGSVLLKLKSAKRPPQPLPDEKAATYLAREDEWYDASFGDVELTELEGDFLRRVFRTMSNAKTLPNNQHLAELAAAIGLKK